MPSRPEPVRSVPQYRDGDGFEVRPFTPSCADLLTRGDHALIGVSTGNSYFNQERLTQLLDWAVRRFHRVDVLHTDLHLNTMHQAEGADEEQATRRAKRSLRDVRRRIRRAVEAVGTVPARLRSMALSETVDLPGYRAVQQHLDREFDGNPQVRRACEEHVNRVLGDRLCAEDDRFRAGLSYLRSELPFLVATPKVLGVPSSVSCYHDLLPVVAELYEDGTCFDPGQGHVVVRPPMRGERP